MREFILIFLERSVRPQSLHASGHFVEGFSFDIAVENLCHRKTIKDYFTHVNANGRSCLKVNDVQFSKLCRCRIFALNAKRFADTVSGYIIVHLGKNGKTYAVQILVPNFLVFRISSLECEEATLIERRIV